MIVSRLECSTNERSRIPPRRVLNLHNVQSFPSCSFKQLYRECVKNLKKKKKWYKEFSFSLRQFFF